MSVTQEIPDVEYALKKWAQTALPSLGGRVFFAVPAGTPALPLATVALVGGTVDDGAAIEYPRVSFRIWANSKKDASDGRRYLITALRALAGDQLDADTFCYGATDIVSLWLPDDEAKLASYVVDCTLIVRRS